jgi:hypothetical protein
MTLYDVTVTNLVTSRPVAQVLVERVDLANAIEAITGCRTMVGAHFMELTPTAEGAFELPRFGPEWVEALREWAAGLLVGHVAGSPDDPRGERAALARAAWLAETIDGQVRGWANGFTVERAGAAKGDCPEAFLALAPLPAQVN